MKRLPSRATGGRLRQLRRELKRRVSALTRARRALPATSYASLVDYHIHTRLCGHARGEPADYARAAIRRGFREIGFADHMPLLRIRDAQLTMAPDQLPGYVEMIAELRASFPELTIRLGIEMDYIPGQMDEVWDAASPFDFDYVYGAVHYIDGWDFGDSRNLSRYKGRDPDDAYARYFDLFCEAAGEGGFDIMAHPDLVKKHGIRTTLSLSNMYEKAADALSEAGVAIEVNTSGLRKAVVEPYPEQDFLRACVSRGVPVTLGSDAHEPEQVGMDFDVALRMLRKANVSEIATFERRTRTMRPLQTGW